MTNDASIYDDLVNRLDFTAREEIARRGPVYRARIIRMVLIDVAILGAGLVLLCLLAVCLGWTSDGAIDKLSRFFCGYLAFIAGYDCAVISGRNSIMKRIKAGL